MEELLLGRRKLFSCPSLAILIALLVSLTSRAQEESGLRASSVLRDSTTVRSVISVQDSLCDRSEQLLESGERNQGYYKASMLCGCARFMSGDFHGASIVFGSLLERRIGDPAQAGVWMVRSLLAAGMSDDAIEYLETRSEGAFTDTLHGALALAIGSVLADQGDSEGALRLIGYGTASLPDSMSCYLAVSLAAVLERVGLRAEADSVLRTAADYCLENPGFMASEDGSKQAEDEHDEGPYGLRVGWFMHPESAAAMGSRLGSDGIDPRVVMEKGMHRIEFGPFEDYDEIEQLMDWLRQLGIRELELIYKE
jgi:hypothetical protein